MEGSFVGTRLCNQGYFQQTCARGVGKSGSGKVVPLTCCDINDDDDCRHERMLNGSKEFWTLTHTLKCKLLPIFIIILDINVLMVAFCCVTLYELLLDSQISRIFSWYYNETFIELPTHAASFVFWTLSSITHIHAWRKDLKTTFLREKNMTRRCKRSKS